MAGISNAQIKGAVEKVGTSVEGRCTNGPSSPTRQGRRATTPLCLT